MKFKQYLFEVHKSHANEAELIYHKIIDNVDNGHISTGDNKLSFNIGNIIKNSNYSNLWLVIRKTTDNNVRLGTDNEGKISIVIDTTKELPAHSKIDTFLDSSEIITGFKREFNKFLQTHYIEGTSSTSHERVSNINGKFEDHYNKLIEEINKEIENYKKAEQLLKHDHDNTINHGKKEVIKGAIEKLLNSFFGDSFGKFKSIVFKYKSGDFFNNLEQEKKKKLLSRLESFYEQHIEPLNTNS